MAKLCVTDSVLSAVIILILGIYTSTAIPESERLRYEIHSTLPYTTLQVVTLDNGAHSLSKRQVDNSSPLSTPVNSTVTVSPNAVQKDKVIIKAGNTTEKESQLSEQNRSNSGQVDLASTVATTKDNQSPPYRGNNLGVNGTGIRLTTPSPTKASTPPLHKVIVSEPIDPVAEEHGNYNHSEGTPLIDDDGVPNFADDLQNSTILEKNITKIVEDYHDYYNSTFLVDSIIGQRYWNDLYNVKNFVHSDLLSTSHRRAITVQLSFDFPFYGHLVRNVTVATGGFLYTGEYVHSWLAATQYIAPLMANFDTSLSNDSYVRYYDNGTAFTVVWEEVTLQERHEDGGFTFSATLHSTGDIVFVYRNVPVLIEKILDDKHPVKVGLSDAYIIDRTIFYARRKTIYEYHRVNFNKEDIKNWTIIYIRALPTCHSFTDCESCLTNNTGFECSWCPTTERCSTGMDRNRQDWLQKGCNRTQITSFNICPLKGSKGNNAAPRSTAPTIRDMDDRSYAGLDTGPLLLDSSVNKAPHTGEQMVPNGHASSISAALIPICLVLILVGWLFYAYRNPHTKSGQMLIRYRPSQWTWRRGEARYTAATIHM